MKKHKIKVGQIYIFKTSFGQSFIIITNFNNRYVYYSDWSSYDNISYPGKFPIKYLNKNLNDFELCDEIEI